MIAGSRNRLERWLAVVVAWFRTVGEQLGHVWRRSLQLRVVVSTLTLSLIVITILGVVLTSQITDRLLDAKINAAVEEMSRARNTVQATLTGVHDSSTQLSRLEDARRALAGSGGSQSGGAAGSYDSALAMVGDSQNELTAGPIQEIPPELRHFVQERQVSYQFAQVSDPDGYRGPALIIGSPAADIPTLEIYLIFPLTNEKSSLSLMRGTMLIGGIVLLVLLAAITALVTRQVVLPIRSAARIASRFADGRLKERMLVRGEDDMARLAMSFNEMAESLSTQITQLEEFGNLQRRFTSDVSHELRTPLTTVRMAADLIHGSSDDLDPALARSAELLVNELDRFEGLLNDLLEISRHDAGVAELQVESLDVRMCARAAVSTVRHLAKESGVELVVDMPEEPLVAEVDPRRVERVLRNLLANAIDHSEGKPVLMRMRGDTDANAVAIVVRDQGVGLRPGEEKLVFNRFWRSDPSRMRRSGGTGLGLSISVEDANLHEGKLEAWGEIGLGASFRLTLPLVRGRKLGASPLPLEPPKKPRLLEAVPDNGGESGNGATDSGLGAALPESPSTVEGSVAPAGPPTAPAGFAVVGGTALAAGGGTATAPDSGATESAAAAAKSKSDDIPFEGFVRFESAAHADHSADSNAETDDGGPAQPDPAEPESPSAGTQPAKADGTESPGGGSARTDAGVASGNGDYATYGGAAPATDGGGDRGADGNGGSTARADAPQPPGAGDGKP